MVFELGKMANGLVTLAVANDIRKLSISNSSNVSNDIKIELTFENESESSITTTIESSVDSGFLPPPPSRSDDETSLCNLFKFDPEYEAVCRDIQSLDLICELFIEKNQTLEIKYCEFMKDALQYGQEILSENFLRYIVRANNKGARKKDEKHNEINNVIRHIITISNKINRIQQVLQDKPWETTLKADPTCQKASLEFFSIACEIMKKIQAQVQDIENYGRNKIALVLESNDEEMQSKLHNIILELAKRIDIMARFRENILLLDQKSSSSSHTESNLLSS
ncbi:uncharacterized protein TNCT_336651 [Trichonephila clavata]|uniref:Uncharacterized protein n=1 Tax=Trichonephila clavata TaxID=2740835 RepID=A0A8X6LJ33_TRICU|nr:uncharacterized protein TNCT_336651 [Trichonephila clavata]